MASEKIYFIVFTQIKENVEGSGKIQDTQYKIFIEEKLGYSIQIFYADIF